MWKKIIQIEHEKVKKDTLRYNKFSKSSFTNNSTLSTSYSVDNFTLSTSSSTEKSTNSSNDVYIYVYSVGMVDLKCCFFLGLYLHYEKCC